MSKGIIVLPKEEGILVEEVEAAAKAEVLRAEGEGGKSLTPSISLFKEERIRLVF